jgi:hypothetical protein
MAQNRRSAGSGPAALNWERDIEVLRDLMLTVLRSHEAAAEDLLGQDPEAAEQGNAPLKRKS